MLNVIPKLQTIKELDTEQSVDDFEKEITALAPGKATGKVGIPAEVLKQGGQVVLTHLHDILLACWREEGAPQAIKGANFICCIKRKLRMVATTTEESLFLALLRKHPWVILKRLQVLDEHVYPEIR